MLTTLQRVLRQLELGCRILMRPQGRRTIVDLSERRREFESKYADKLGERLKREGVASIEDFKAKVSPGSRPAEPVAPRTSEPPRKEGDMTSTGTSPVRRDSSPVKPLADFMDLKKILSKNATAEQVSTLWTAYHSTRSQGTGRGYLSATIPLASYLKMTSLATKYPSFLLPLPRPSVEPEGPETAHEFHFLQWGFHETPPHPSQRPSLLFDEPLPPGPETTAPKPIYSTILFTPLQEYKLRQTFAQPHLVITHYTDLATTHGIVLMRGELTASPSSPEKFLLSQVDAQLLAIGVQRFYLRTEDRSSELRVAMLRKFHERPAEFQWEELLSAADLTR